MLAQKKKKKKKKHPQQPIAVIQRVEAVVFPRFANLHL